MNSVKFERIKISEIFKDSYFSPLHTPINWQIPPPFRPGNVVVHDGMVCVVEKNIKGTDTALKGLVGKEFEHEIDTYQLRDFFNGKLLCSLRRWKIERYKLGVLAIRR